MDKHSIARAYAASLGASWESQSSVYQNSQYRILCLGKRVMRLKGLRELDSHFQGEWTKETLDYLPVFPHFSDPELYEVLDPDFLKTIESHFTNSDVTSIINACEPSREGELFFWELYDFLSCDKPVSRVWESEYPTKAVVERALDNLKDASFYNLRKEAAYAKKQADWLLGMNLTIAYTAASGAKYTVGPVQTPVLQLIAFRDELLQIWLPMPFDVLTLPFDGYTATFRPRNSRYSNYPYSLPETDALELLKAILPLKEGIVTEVHKEIQTVSPPRLYSLAGLQIDANKKFGFTAHNTYQIAQKLFERSVITYPRTASHVIGSQHYSRAVQSAQVLAAHYRIPFQDLYLSTINMNDTELVDHPAIIPLAVLPDDASAEEQKIYRLILLRFFEAMSQPGLDQHIRVQIDVGGLPFEATADQLIEPGWRTIQQPLPEGTTPLARFQKGYKVRIAGLPKLQHEGIKRPEPFTEAELIAVMANIPEGIQDSSLREAMDETGGRLSTDGSQDTVIELLIERGYIKRELGALVCTPVGQALINTVHPSIKNPFARAQSEGLLTQYHSPEAVSVYLQGIYDLVLQASEHAKELTASKIVLPSLGVRCPYCQSDMVDRVNHYGCVSCDFTLPKSYAGHELTFDDIQGLITQGRTDILQLPSIKKEKETYSARIVLNETRLSLAYPSKEEMSLGSCPKCHEGFVYPITSQVFACSKCDFHLWRTVYNLRLSQNQIRKLLKDGILPMVHGLRAKTGTSFHASLRLNENGKITADRSRERGSATTT